MESGTDKARGEGHWLDDRFVIWCECGDTGHSVILDFTVFYKEISMEVNFNVGGGLLSRLKEAFRLVFFTHKHEHGEIIVGEKQARALRHYLDRYLDSFNGGSNDNKD